MRVSSCIRLTVLPELKSDVSVRRIRAAKMKGAIQHTYCALLTSIRDGVNRAFSAGDLGYRMPGALPQAEADAAPLALDTYLPQARHGESVRRRTVMNAAPLALTVLYKQEVGQMCRVSQAALRYWINRARVNPNSQRPIGAARFHFRI